jgi:hypothetical protein
MFDEVSNDCDAYQWVVPIEEHSKETLYSDFVPAIIHLHPDTHTFIQKNKTN